VARKAELAGDAIAAPPPGTDYPETRVPAPDVIEAQGFPLVVFDNPRWKAAHGGRFKTYPDRDAPDGVATPYKAGRTYTLGYGATVEGEPWLVSKNGSWAPQKNFNPADDSSSS
jgi:hypothetical protein